MRREEGGLQGQLQAPTASPTARRGRRGGLSSKETPDPSPLAQDFACGLRRPQNGSSCKGKALLSPRINTDYVRRGQVTSRSGVLKAAQSRVVIGENASGEGGLAGAFSTHGTPGQAQHSAKDAVWVTLSRRAMDLFPHALDARVGHPGYEIVKDL